MMYCELTERYVRWLASRSSEALLFLQYGTYTPVIVSAYIHTQNTITSQEMKMAYNGDDDLNF